MTATILIVEDDRIILKVLADMLAKRGYKPIIASSREQALALVEQENPDLAILDIHLGTAMDGIDLAKALRSHHGVPCIYVSASTDEAIFQKARATQPYGFLVKPVKEWALYATLEVALGRIETDLQLEESEERYRIVSELIPDYAYAFRVDPDGSLHGEWVTDAFNHVTGYETRELLSGESWNRLFHPDDVSNVQAHIQTILLGQTHELEYRLVRRDGEIRWVRSYDRPVWDETESRVVRVYGAVQDITERKRAEQNLNKAYTQLQGILEYSPTLIVIFDEHGNYMRVSGSAARHFDLSAEQFVGQNLENLLPPEAAARTQKHIQQVFKTKQPVVIEERLLEDDQRVFTTTLFPFLDPHGEPYAVCAIAADISERVQTELALKESQENLARAQHIAHLGNWDWDLATTQLHGSDEINRIFALEPGNSEANYDEFFERIHPDDRTAQAQAIERALKSTPKQDQRDFDHEYRILRSDGSVRHVHSLGQVVRDENDRPLRMFGITQDITERIQMESQLRQTLQEKDILLQEIHHRVMNNFQLVATILSFQADAAQDPHAIAVLQESVHRIYTLARIHEQLYRSPDFSQIDLSDYIRSLTKNLLETYRSSLSHPVDLELGVEDLSLELKQTLSVGLIITELVSNAFKYAFPSGWHPPQDSTARIEVGLHILEAEKYELVVHDNGVGLPSGVQDAGRDPEQDSLGMLLVNTFATQLRGEIEWVTHPGQGATCRIVFPA
jgi:PAS domain S-box-containing protein